jgi:hypothetical protein
MGTAQQRLIKSQNFTHYHDDLSWLNTHSYDSMAHRDWIRDQPLAANQIPPSGDVRHVLLPYDSALLPAEIFASNDLRSFLLPDHNDHGVA